MGLVQIANERNSIVIGDRISIAGSSLTPLFGLLGKRQLDAGKACGSFLRQVFTPLG